MHGQFIHSVHAVVLNWNEFDDTVQCIQSLKNSAAPFSRIILLDQASPDRSGSRLEQLYQGDQQVLVIRNEKNHGFAEGANIGIRHALSAGADMVFLINNDTIVDKNCVERLLEVLTEMPLAAAAGPVIMYFARPDKVWQAGGSFSKLKMGISDPGKGRALSEIGQSISQVTFLTGCALMVKAMAFHKVGYFDPSYFFYGEDADFAIRIHDAGMTMYFVPTAKVWHKIDDIATDRTSPFVLYHLARSSVLMLRKRFSGLERWYGIILQFMLYTPFRFWQILRGGRGWDSVGAWLKGLGHGVTARIDHETRIDKKHLHTPE